MRKARRLLRLLAGLALGAVMATGTLAAPPAASWQRVADDPYGGLPGAAATVGPDQRIYIIFENQFQRFAPQTQRWTMLPVQITPYHSGLIAIGDQLYAVGGWQDPHVAASINGAYSLRTGTWRYIARSHCAHVGSGAALGHDGRIYMGGGDVIGPGTCFEAYDPRTDRWTKLASIPRRVSDPGVVAGVDGRIYFIGGRSYDRHYHPLIVHDVQVYDLRSSRWSSAAPMPTARTDLTAVTASDGKIYAIGGSTIPFGYSTYVYPKALATVEVYDPQVNRWSKGPSLGVPRVGLAAVVTPEGIIYAIGGIGDDLKGIRSVESLRVPRAGK